MRYRTVANVDISEVGLDCPASTRFDASAARALLERALGRGLNFLRAAEAEETSVLGEALLALGARRGAALAAGVSEFFASHARHRMTIEQFLEHELDNQLTRAKSDYLDCFFIDVGTGRGVDVEAILREGIRAGDAARQATFEGGAFLHETLSDAVAVIERFKKQGRVRLSGISGDSVALLKRILVRNRDFDVAFVPYNYAFREAADELIPIASQTSTAVVATRPLCWAARAIPISVLAGSPFPPDRAAIGIDEAALARLACKWPLTDPGVTSVLAEVESPAVLGAVADASADRFWTRSDEETMQRVAQVAGAQQGLLLILSAMNSPDGDVRARGWSAYVRRGLPEAGFDPFGGSNERAQALRSIAKAVVKDETVITGDGVEDLE